MLSVFLNSRRTNDLHLASCQCRLKYIRRVNGTLSRTRTDYGVYFINEQNYVRILQNLLHNVLQTLFKLTSVFCTGKHTRNIECYKSLTQQRFRHVTLNDPLSQALCNGSFTDAGLAYKTGIILCSSG